MNLGSYPTWKGLSPTCPNLAKCADTRSSSVVFRRPQERGTAGEAAPPTKTTCVLSSYQIHFYLNTWRSRSLAAFFLELFSFFP